MVTNVITMSPEEVRRALAAYLSAREEVDIHPSQLTDVHTYTDTEEEQILVSMDEHIVAFLYTFNPDDYPGGKRRGWDYIRRFGLNYLAE